VRSERRESDSILVVENRHTSRLVDCHGALVLHDFIEVVTCGRGSDKRRDKAGKGREREGGRSPAVRSKT
jgi:hypothetical protein